MQTSKRLCKLTSIATWILSLTWPLTSFGDLLNRIEVYKQNDVGVIHILVTRPLIYTHHFPPDHSTILHIYFNDLTLNRGNTGMSTGRSMSDPTMDRNNQGMQGAPTTEFMRAPSNDIVPMFWVSYNNHGTADMALDPFHLMVQFAEPVHYKITADANNQGFLIFVLSTDASPNPSPENGTTKDTAKEKNAKPSNSTAPLSDSLDDPAQ